MNMIENIGSLANVTLINQSIIKDKIQINDLEFSVNEEYDRLYESFVSEVNKCFGDIGFIPIKSNRLGK